MWSFIYLCIFVIAETNEESERLIFGDVSFPVGKYLKN